MKRILAIFLSVALIASSGFARAGKSYSRSSSSSYGSSSSSHSYSRPTPSYSRPAPVQRTYTKPNPPRPVAAPVTRPAPTATHTTVNRTTVIHKNYNNGGSNGYNNNRNNNNNNNNNDNGNNGGGGGMGIMGTIAGVGGGIVVGNLLTSALMGDHRNAGYAPHGGYASTPAGVPLAGQPVAPAMAGATSGSYVTDGNGGVIPAEQYQASTTGNQVTPSSHDQGMSTTVSTVPTTPVDHGFDWFSWYMWLVYIVFGIGLIMLTISLYNRWRVARDRKLEIKQMLEEENNLNTFKRIFTQVQQSYASGANINLVHMTTAPMYADIMLQRSETEDNGLTNVIEEVKILSITNMQSWESEGIQFQQVKIRFSMIDYTIDDKGTVHHGSQTTPETAVEYWTFQSSSKNDWILSAIDQHSGYVHQVAE